MAWSASGVFKEWLFNPGLNTLRAGETGPTSFTDLDTDVIKVALFDTDPTPNADAAVGSTGYNTGVWLSSDEVVDATNWVAGGRALAPSGDGIATGTSMVKFDAPDLAGGGTLTLTAFFGCLVYDDTITGGTVANQGMCFNYFGGTNTVTSGTLTIIWHADGIWKITV